MITHDIGKFFWGIENVKGKFIRDVSTVHEGSHPYRYCPNANFIHVTPSKALVLGWWKTRDVPAHVHLMEAIKGRELEIQAQDIRRHPVFKSKASRI